MAEPRERCFQLLVLLLGWSFLAGSRLSCEAFSSVSPPTSRFRKSAISLNSNRQGDGEVLVEDLYGETDIATPDDNKISKRELIVSSTVDMPFSAEVAFDAFSDLTRQPSWSSWLRSVEYLKEEELNERERDHYGLSKWTVGVRGFRFSWNAVTTVSDRPSLIEWESISGLKNRGRVDFSSKQDGTHSMTLQMTFIAPRFAATLFRKSSSVVWFVENKMLKTTLEKFRTVVSEQDLGQG